jgi:UDP-GlcNAc:undecaprenyl-phosphate/decaprenyl-phosphate GlcNAc-1-phosphate transferase
VGYIWPALLALLTTSALLPALMAASGRLGLMDRPGERKQHERSVPRVGGLAIAGGAAVGLVAAAGSAPVGAWFYAGAAVIVLFGALDDRFDLDYRVKFAGQCIAVGLVMANGVLVRALYLEGPVELAPIVSLVITGLFLVGITNAVNLSDGLDGLAGGTTFLCLAALGLLAAHEGQSGPAIIAAALGGAVIGFLRFNTYPAAVFMGDAGSQLLGYTVGVVSLLATQGAGATISPSLPVLLLGVPILDTTSVFVQRLMAGQSPFRPDRKHLHHRLLALGLDHHEVVAVIYAVQALLFVAAYALRYESDLVILGAFGTFCLASVILIETLSRRGWRFRTSAPGLPSALSRWVRAVSREQGLPRTALFLVAGFIALYAGLAVVATRDVPADVRYVAIGLLSVLGAGAAVYHRRALTRVEKGGLYALLATVVYLDARLPALAHPWRTLDWLLPLSVAALTALRLRLAEDVRFAVTPLDLLVLFVALVVPNLPGVVDLPRGAGIAVAKLVILFYGFELIANRTVAWAFAARAAGIAASAGILIRAFGG